MVPGRPGNVAENAVEEDSLDGGETSLWSWTILSGVAGNVFRSLFFYEISR